MRRISRSGFTLVELLIVITIIALLVSILMPAISRAHEMAARATCLSNIRQLQMGWIAYANEHKGKICSYSCLTLRADSVPLSQSTVPRGGWLTCKEGNPTVVDFPNSRMWRYVNNINTYYCPNDTRPVKGTADPRFTGVGNTAVMSYAMNTLLGNDQVIRLGFGTTMTQITQVKHPERTFVFMESGPVNVGTSGIGPPIYPNAIKPPIFAPTFHMSGGMVQGATISFADGHAIFWNFVDVTPAPSAFQQFQVMGWDDKLQLAAWSGGPLPPGVTP